MKKMAVEVEGMNASERAHNASQPPQAPKASESSDQTFSTRKAGDSCLLSSALSISSHFSTSSRFREESGVIRCFGEVETRFPSRCGALRRLEVAEVLMAGVWGEMPSHTYRHYVSSNILNIPR